MTSATATRGSGLRSGAMAVHRVLGILTTAAVVVQFALAGFGAFGALRGADESYAAHEMLGYGIGLLTLLMLIAALLGRPTRAVLLLTVLLFVLAGPVQPLLAGFGRSDSAWIGALHAANGLLIGGLAGRLGPGAALARHR